MIRSFLVPFILLFELAAIASAAPFIQADSNRLEPETTLKLHFDKPMVPAGQVEQEGQIGLVIKPALKHRVIWETDKVARVEWLAPPRPGMTYQMSLKAGSKHLDNSVVPRMPEFKINSPGLLLQYGRQISPSSEGIRMHEYFLRFNLAIAAAKAERHLVYRDDAGQQIKATVRHPKLGELTSKYYRRPSWNERFRILRGGEPVTDPESLLKNGLIVSPVSPLPVGVSWRLVIDDDLRASSYPVKLNEPISRRIGTVAPMGLRSAGARVLLDTPRSIYLNFNHPIADYDAEQLAKMVDIKPKVPRMEMKIDGQQLLIRGEFTQPRQSFSITVAKGFSSRDGLPLPMTAKEKVTFRPLKAQLTLPGFDHGLFAKGRRAQDFLAVNMRDCRIRLKKLTPEELPLALQAYRHYKNGGPHRAEVMNGVALPYELVPGTQVFDESHQLEQALDRSKYLKLDWNRITGSDDGVGTYFVQLSGRGTMGRKVVTQSIVQLTDIGLGWKFTEKEALVYAYSCESGTPLEGVTLRLCGADGEIRHESTTGADGTARFPRSEEDYYLVAKRGEECFGCGFYGRVASVPMWRFPVRFSWHAQPERQRKLFLFSDRSLYRPGEVAHFKGMLRDLAGNDIVSCPDRSAELTIRDSRFRVLTKKTIRFSELGSFDESFTIPEHGLGMYRVQVYFPRPEGEDEPEGWYQQMLDRQSRLFEHFFMVGEFRRNAFEINAETSPLEAGERDFDLSMRAGYYQGQPVAGGEVAWFMRATRTGFYPEKYRDFYFGDHREYDSHYWYHYFGYRGSRRSSRDVHSEDGDLRLTGEGAATLGLKVPEFDFPSPVKVDISLEVTDPRDQTLSHGTSLTSHPVDTYIGIQRTDSLVNVGDALEIPLVAVDHHGQGIKRDLEVEAVITRHWTEKVAVVNGEGEKTVTNEEREETFAESLLTLRAGQPAALNFRPDKSGSHVITLTARDSEGREIRTAVRLRVYGDDEYPWAYENGMRIKLVPEKTRYQPGETARILVQTPIEGSALVTVERDKVLRSFVRRLSVDDPVVEVPLGDEDAPNVFISVMVVRGSADSLKEIKEPELKLGYCELEVENRQQRLRVELDEAAGSKRPGESITLSGRVLDHTGKPVPKAEVVLYAEDEGVLSVMGYENPDPMGYFYEGRFLRVSAGTSLAEFLAEDPANREYGNKGFFVGGGADGFGGMDVGEVRKDFNPCAVWAPRLSTGDDGRFSVSYESPDTLTRYRIIAVAAAGAENFGTGIHAVTINQPVMLEPSAPRFASMGDALDAKTVLFNSSEYSGTWEVRLESNAICSPVSNGADPESSRQVTLAPGERATLVFRQAFNATGTARWRWSAVPVKLEGRELSPSLRRDLSDTMGESFEVNYPMPTLRDRVVEQHLPIEEEFPIYKGLDPDLVGGTGTVKADLALSQLVRARHLSDDLLRYPYGCAEQTTSSMMPWLTVEALAPYVPALAARAGEEREKALKQGIRRLLAMQTSSGGFGYWPGASEATDWSSSYVILALIRCQQQGITVPDEVINDACDYLQRGFKEAPESSWQAQHQARALWALALAGRPDTAYQNRLLEMPALLGESGRAFLALALARSGAPADRTKALELLTGRYPAAKSCYWMKRQPHTAQRLLALCALKVDDSLIQVTLKKVLDECDADQLAGTTWANSWSLQAMAAVADYEKDNAKEVSFQLVVKDELEQVTLNSQQVIKSLEEPTRTPQPAIVSQLSAPLIRMAEVEAKPAITDTPAKVGSSGITLTRRYERVLKDGTTEALNNPQVGDLVLVSLTLQVPERQSYLVVDDPIPAAFEIVNDDFASQSAAAIELRAGSWRVSHRELHDDRALFFFDSIQTSGTETIRYLARITRAGKAIAPAAKAEPMYRPEEVALSPAENLRIAPKL